MPDYTTADVRYARHFKGSEFSFGVNNLFNHQFYTYAFGCTAGQVDSVYPEAGRAFIAAVRVKF
jgi:iron complex outermembrane receptor protein